MRIGKGKNERRKKRKNQLLKFGVLVLYLRNAIKEIILR